MVWDPCPPPLALGVPSCQKDLRGAGCLGVWLLWLLSVAVSDVLGIVAHNLVASFGSRGGKPSRCVWVDALRLDYASFLAYGPVPKCFVLAHHDTLRVDLVNSWQAEADRLAKAGLLLARPFTVPLPSLPLMVHTWSVMLSLLYIPNIQVCVGHGPLTLVVLTLHAGNVACPLAFCLTLLSKLLSGCVLHHFVMCLSVWIFTVLYVAVPAILGALFCILIVYTLRVPHSWGFMRPRALCTSR